MPERPRPGSASKDSVQELVRVGRLERVRPNRRHQGALLNHAGENIAGAQRAAPVSPSLALTGAFDAARHCVDAYLNLKGLRARSGDGADRVRVDYAKLAMGELISAADLQDYQTARQIRQMVESAEADRPIRVRQVDAERAIDLAKRFHRAVSSLVDDSN